MVDLFIFSGEPPLSFSVSVSVSVEKRRVPPLLNTKTQGGSPEKKK